MFFKTNESFRILLGNYRQISSQAHRAHSSLKMMIYTYLIKSMMKKGQDRLSKSLVYLKAWKRVIS